MLVEIDRQERAVPQLGIGPHRIVHIGDEFLTLHYVVRWMIVVLIGAEILRLQERKLGKRLLVSCILKELVDRPVVHHVLREKIAEQKPRRREIVKVVPPTDPS